MFHHGNSQEELVIDKGKIYWVKKTTTNGTRYLACKESKTWQRCPGSAIQTTTGVIKERKTHRCVVNQDKHVIYDFERKLRTEVINSSDDLRIVYDRVARSCAQGSVISPFAHVEKKMNEWRGKSRPPQPKDLLEYANLINNERWKPKYTHYDGGVWTVTCIRAIDGSHSVICGDATFVNSLQTQDLYLDATFQVCPQRLKIRQLLTVMARVDGEHIPITWALMEKKTTAAYVSVLQYFKDHLAMNLRPKTFSVDFEQGLSSAIRMVYGNAMIIRCFFHHIQRLTKKFLKLHGKKGYKTLLRWPRGLLFFRKMAGLALLPSTEIRVTFRTVVRSAGRDIRLYFARFLRYYERWWINTVKPANYSVFGYERRTNNPLEAYHRVLKKRMNVHPTIWNFTDKLLEIQQIARNEVMSMARGLSVRRETARKYLLRQEIIKKAWLMYTNNQLNAEKLITATSHFLAIGGKQFLITEPQQLDVFVNDLSFNEIVNIFNIPQVTVIDHIIPVNGDNVLILRKLNLHRCTFCNANAIADHVSVSCWHWFSCRECFNEIFNALANRNIVCNSCNEIITELRHIDWLNA